MKKQITIASAPAAILAGTMIMSASNGDSSAPTPGTETPVEVVELPYVPGIAPNQMNPITAAPEYVFPSSPNQLLNLDQDRNNYGTWSQMDSLNDLYQLSETVRLRKAVENLTAAVEAANE